MTYSKNSCLFVLFFLSALYSCNNKPDKTFEVIIKTGDPAVINTKISELLKNIITNTDAIETLIAENDSLPASAFVKKFYQRNNYYSVWFNKGYSTAPADTLFNIIQRADEYGLIPDDYHYKRIDSLFRYKKPDTKKYVNIGALTAAELMLTDAYFTLAIHINKGRLDKDSLTKKWNASVSDSNLINMLNEAIKNNAIRQSIDSLEPKNKQYKALKVALKNFKTAFKNNDWDSTFFSDTLPFEECLKKRLIASRDYFDEYEGNEAEKLLKAIKNFQCKNNLTEDGKTGKQTMIALKKSKQDYIRQIEMNMELWRYYQEPEDEKYVWVNIPKFEMKVVENDSIIIRSRVIVGSPKNPTPVVKSSIQYMLIYPYWNVPYKIATKEILPILKKNPAYLKRKNFEVLNHKNQVVTQAINWKKYDEKNFPWKLRQRIGDDNALGILKFYFRNKYGIYMHDTDNRNLFNLENRALSHGCIRLEKFIDVALFLIKKDSLLYPPDDFKIDILQEKQKYVYIKPAVPIYINYFTAEVDENGEIFYSMDIYDRDKKMIQAIYRH